MKSAAAFACGLLFAVGLAVAGMTDPAKVIGFLDVGGAWDPSLAFVMIGGIAVVAAGYRSGARRPLFEARFPELLAKSIDARLVVGAAIFGIGWGLVGFCPGPAIVAIGAFVHGSIPFVAAMLVGLALVQVSDL